MGLVLLYWIKPRDNLGAHEVSLSAPFSNFTSDVSPDVRICDVRGKSSSLISPKLFSNCDCGPGFPCLYHVVQSTVHDAEVRRNADGFFDR